MLALGTHLPLRSTLSPSHSKGQTRLRSRDHHLEHSQARFVGCEIVLRELGELRERGTTLRAPLSVDFTAVTPDPVERRLQAARQRLALGSALHLGLGFATGLVIAGLCLLA